MRQFLIAATLTFVVSSQLAAEEWHSLFDGKSLTGWKTNENHDSWKVIDGALVSQGDRCHLFYVGDVANHNFKNFEFSAEVMTTPGSNSGIYVHTHFQESGWPEAGYELQVINSNPPGDGYQENKMTGSIYAVRNTWIAPVRDNEWFTYRIVVSGKTLQTYVNGEKICEYTESDSPWRSEDKQKRLLSSGTFALQAHDPGSVVHYRKLRVKILPDDSPSLGQAMQDKELNQLITELSNNNFALIDVGVHGPDSTKVESTGRFFGVSLPKENALAELSTASTPVLVVNDRQQAPSVELLAAAKEAGAKVAFSSGGATSLDGQRLKARLMAIKAAGLGWKDMWIPGKD